MWVRVGVPVGVDVNVVVLVEVGVFVTVGTVVWVSVGVGVEVGGVRSTNPGAGIGCSRQSEDVFVSMQAGYRSNVQAADGAGQAG